MIMFYSEKIETTELCEYGCGQVAKYKNKKKKMCSSYHTSCPTNKIKNSHAGRKKHFKKICASSSNSCPELKRRNSESLSEAYKNGIRKPATEVYKNIPIEIKKRM